MTDDYIHDCVGGHPQCTTSRRASADCPHCTHRKMGTLSAIIGGKDFAHNRQRREEHSYKMGLSDQERAQVELTSFNFFRERGKKLKVPPSLYADLKAGGCRMKYIEADDALGSAGADIQMTRAVIAVPFANDFCMTDFALSLAALLGRMAHDSLRRPVDVALIHQSGSLIMDARNHLADVAVNRIEGATHILFLDSDMTFPPDTLQRLLNHKVPIVGADYVKRNDLGKLLGIEDMSPHHPNAPALGLKRMLSLPFGCILIKTDVFRALPRPWFRYLTHDAVRSTGEDTYFCHLAREHGYTIWQDPRLTAEIGHVGTHIYRPPGVTTHPHRLTLKDPA